MLPTKPQGETMKRRSGGQPVKTRRRETVTPKRNNAAKAVRSRSPSIADLQEQLDHRTRELNEAREQQTATAEVLRIISMSRGELKPVFQAMLENATRLCQASFGNLLLQEGDEVRIAAMHNAPPAFSELRRRMPVFRPPEWTRDSDKPYLHIADCAE